MDCPYCEEELNYHDYYGRGIPGREGFEKTGDIYKCENEDCEMFDENFYTDKQNDLHEGYPC